METEIDEIVEVGIVRNKRIVVISMVKSELETKSPKRILEDAVNDENLDGKTRKELALCKKIINFSAEPTAFYFNGEDNVRHLPYEEVISGDYLVRIGDKLSIDINYYPVHHDM